MIQKIHDIFIGKNFHWWKLFLRKILLNPQLVLSRFNYNIRRIFFDFLAFFGFVRYPYNIVFIAGMPMSATTWVKNMFARIQGYSTRVTPMPYSIAVNQDIIDSAFKYTPSYGYTLFKTHLNPTPSNVDIIRNNNVKKVIVTYRDFRDVVVARYHRLISVPKTPRDPHYLDYSSITKEEAINHCIDVVRDDFAPWIDGWLDIYKEDSSFVYFCRFEKLIHKPEVEFGKMLGFYGIDIKDCQIESIVKATKGKGKMLNNINKGTLQPWAYSSNFRSGKVGGWKDDFSSANIKYFKDQLGKELIKLGYETNNDW